MSEHSKHPHDWKSLREKVIGLGEESIRKSYYPELQQRLRDLEESEARYRSLVEDVSDMIWESDQDFRLTYVSPRVRDLLGYEPKEILGLTPFDVMNPKEAEHLREKLAPIARAHKPISLLETTMYRKNGTPIIVEVSAKPVFDAEGKYLGYRGTDRDITARKLAEKALRDSETKFRALAENAESIIFIVQDGKFIYTNPYFSKLIGYTKEELQSMDGTLLVHPDFRELVRDRMGRRMRGEPVQPHYEFIMVSKDGKEIWIDYYASKIEYRGNPAIVGVGYDITQRKQLDAEKRAFYRETILSATDGKLAISDRADIEPYIAKAQFAKEIHPYDLGTARNEVKGFCRSHKLPENQLGDFMMGVGEAIDNAVKHAGEGCVYAGADSERIWVAVSDKGSGIESLILPKAVLRRGFSTKPSLGLGYSIILQVADQTLLFTGKNGTTVVLVENLHEEPKSILDSIPDTWEGVSSIQAL